MQMRNGSPAKAVVKFAASVVAAMAALAWGCGPAPAAPPAAGAGNVEIHIESEPSGAKVILDGIFAGTTPLTVADLTPGHHELYVSMAGYRTEIVDLLLDGGPRTVAVKLKPLPGMPSVPDDSRPRPGPGWAVGPGIPSPRLDHEVPPPVESAGRGLRFGPADWVADKSWAGGGLVAAVHMAENDGIFYITPDGDARLLAATGKQSPLAGARRLPAGRGVIAAHRDPAAIWWYRDDGDDVLLHEGSSFQVSPDGRLVLIFGGGPVAVYDLDTGRKTTYRDIAPGGPPEPGADVAWIPGSRRFIAPRLIPGGGADLAVYDGTGKDAVWTAARKGHALVPALAPYGRWVAAVAVPVGDAVPSPAGVLPRPFGTSLIVIDTATRHAEEFVPGEGASVLGPPVWDEGGSELLFAVGTYRLTDHHMPAIETSEIWAMEPPAAPEPVEAAALITGAKSVDSVSPGGRHITVVRHGDFIGDAEVWLVDRKEGDARLLPDVYPPVKWLGPERFIALGELEGRLDIGIFHIDGTVTPLPAPPGGQTHAVSVLPGGSVAAVEWSAAEGDEVYIDLMDLDALE